MTTIEVPARPTARRLASPHLRALESEAIHIFREVAGQFDKPVILFSAGKDSVLVLHLARKAFHPAALPFALLHVDTGHNFPEVLDFRDRVVAGGGLRLQVAKVQDWIDDGRLTERPDGTRNPLQTVPLVDTIAEQQFDAVIGGARRDEERSRAKERIFSLRDSFGGWDPRRQRPELWRLYNGRHAPGEHVRVFPLSNWTELDVWNLHRGRGHRPTGDLLRARARGVRPQRYVARTGGVGRPTGLQHRRVRYRTVGDMSCTGAVDSDASDVRAVIEEIIATRITERGATRADDRLGEAAMEDRKREGYF